MRVNQCASFQADFPDDAIENDEGFVEFGGHGVAGAIGEFLTRLGCKVSEPINAGEHGWELDVEIDRRHLWCQVTDVVDYMILVFEDQSAIDKVLKRYDAVYIDTIKKLNLALNADERFHDVKWHAEGIDPSPSSPHTLSPVIDEG